MGLYNFQARFAPRIQRWATDPEHPEAKAHTIRAPRKRRRRKDGTLVSREDKPGNKMYLYTGLRHEGAARIIDPVACAKVESVVIKALAHMPFFDARKSNAQPEGTPVAWSIFIGPFLDDVLDDANQQAYVKAHPERYGLVELDAAEREQLARRDGFDTRRGHRSAFESMMAFWDRKLPWYGHIFHWRKANG